MHDACQFLVDVMVFWRIGFKHDEIGNNGSGLIQAHANFDAAGFGFIGTRDHTAVRADAVSDAYGPSAQRWVCLLLGGSEGAVEVDVHDIGLFVTNRQIHLCPPSRMATSFHVNASASNSSR